MAWQREQAVKARNGTELILTNPSDNINVIAHLNHWVWSIHVFDHWHNNVLWYKLGHWEWLEDGIRLGNHHFFINWIRLSRDRAVSLMM